MSQKPDIDGASIIIRGSFNPAIFHPIWFKHNNLIRPEEADAAKLEVTHSDISIFSTEWFDIQVARNLFALKTSSSAHFEPIRDLAFGIFSLLEHTPVGALGLNRMMHFKVASEEKWHSFGDLIAPKKIWHDVVKDPGLISLTRQYPKNSAERRVRIKVEPSIRVQPGAYFEINNHYQIKEGEYKKVIKVLNDNWENDLSDSLQIADHLLSNNF